MYRSLQAERIVETAGRLALRVGERFPGAGLSRVAKELEELCSGLSRTIWQKAMILDRYAGAAAPRA